MTQREMRGLGMSSEHVPVSASAVATNPARNRTSHTYDSAIADQVFAHIPSFLPDARDLLKRLQPHVA